MEREVYKDVLLQSLATQVYLAVYRWYLKFQVPNPPTPSLLLEDVDISEEIKAIYRKVTTQ